MRIRRWLTFGSITNLFSDGGFYSCPLTYPPGALIWGPTTCDCLKVGGGATLVGDGSPEDPFHTEGDSLPDEHIGLSGLTAIVTEQVLLDHPELVGVVSVGDTISLGDWTSRAQYITSLILYVSPTGTGSLAGAGGYLGYNEGCHVNAEAGLWGLKGTCGEFKQEPPTFTTVVNGPDGPVDVSWVNSASDPTLSDHPWGTAVSGDPSQPYLFAVDDISEIVVGIHGAYSQIAYSVTIIATTGYPDDDGGGGGGEGTPGHIHSAWV